MYRGLCTHPVGENKIHHR